MKTYIALLRGINVGGHRKVPMAELKKLMADTGFENVKTYIQSGNIVFQTKKENPKELEIIIYEAIIGKFGFEASVIVKTRSQLQKIFDDCPFSEQKKMDSYFAMFSQIPETNLVKEASEKTYENEEYEIINDCLYLYCANGYGKAKFSLNYFEKKLNVSATSRNYKTMLKLLSLSKEMED
ncbi:MAG: DUF1697 domain-containing protein [Winogradskyella sp.]